jgi:acetylornithine/N-succinyldiaminopimelate aminotransferase
VVPNGDLIDACRAEKLLLVAAGDNVARLVPPLIVSEAEVGEAMLRLDRACTAIEQAQKGALKQGAAG